MTDDKFKIRREDGRSDAEIVTDLVSRASSGDILSFDDIVCALQSGCDREFTISDARAAVYKAERRLLSEQSRALLNVRGYGYKVAYASEHNLIARNRKARSDVMLKKGLDVLRHVRWDDMDDNQRAAHEGTLMVLSGIVAAQDAIAERQSLIEKRIRETVGL
jgi:hypothetical protein